MFMDLPTIQQQLTILIRQPIRTGEWRPIVHTIVGHICVPAGGGEAGGRAFVAGAFGELAKLKEQKSVPILIRLL